MRRVTRETTSYALLLVILFALAALAVRQLLEFLHPRVLPHDAEVAALMIGAITFGFMLIAGAFGLWAIQFAAAAEGLRRVGRLVNAMDYIQDGVLAVDRKGRITGSNPAIRNILGNPEEAELTTQTLAMIFPCLTPEDVEQIIEAPEPFEVERRLPIGDELKVLRFRSQPLEGFTLLLISDVTRMDARRVHLRLMARLQLIGQIARGVAHDFNTILCAISGHASLLPRLSPGSPDAEQSIRAIQKGAERGTSLAAKLLELSNPGADQALPGLSADDLEPALKALRDSLPDGWNVDGQIGDIPPMALTGIKLEQIILNLGMLIVDRMPRPGTLRLVAAPPMDNHPLLKVSPINAGVLALSAAPLNAAVAMSPAQEEDGAGGVILSVIRGMVEESGGALDTFRAADGSPIFRVTLPRENPSLRKDGRARATWSTDLAPYVAQWRVLLVAGPIRAHALSARLNALAVRLERVDGLMPAMGRMEGAEALDAIIIDQRQLGDEARGLLHALIRLAPNAAVVVLTDGPLAETLTAFQAQASFIPMNDAPDRILMALVEARSLAVKRKAGSALTRLGESVG